MEKLEQFKELITNAKHIAVLTGAGVSTLSGIPDFRSPNGLYNTVDPEFSQFSPEYLLSHECLYHNPKVFYKFYRAKMNLTGVEPNIVHKTIADWETLGKRVSIATQNIDGLHTKAGSTEVYEIHGTTAKNYCTKCGKAFDANAIFDNTDEIPRCPDCKGVGFIRPAVTLYNEQLPDDFANAIEAFGKADLLVIAGTSLQVMPAAMLPSYYFGKDIVIINKERPLMASPYADSVPTVWDYADLVFDDLNEVFTGIS